MAQAETIVVVATRRIRDEAKRLEEEEKATRGTPKHKYPMASVRSLAKELGFSDEMVTKIIAYCVDNGFHYCIDHTVPVKDPDNPDKQEFPDWKVCYWGVDQLRSRLDWVLPR